MTKDELEVIQRRIIAKARQPGANLIELYCWLCWLDRRPIDDAC